MAQAVEQHIPGAWSLTDLLEYLTLAPFGYEIGAGLREMERRISTGELPLIDEEYVDGKLRARYKLNSFYFRTNYTLKFDYHDQVVRVVRQRMELGDGIVHRYFVLKQDAHRVWPPRPPASQTAPNQQLEDKTGPDPFKTGAAGRPKAAHLIQDEAKRRIAEKEVTPTQGGLTAFSGDLENWWDVERQTFNPPGPSMTAGSIKNAVRELWNAALLDAQN